MKPPNVKTKVYIHDKESRTLFAFLQSLKHAEEGAVVFISKQQIGELPKNLQMNQEIDRNILKRITFSYPSGWNEILSKLFNLHTWKVTPSTIIINALEEYIPISDLESGAFQNNSSPFLLCSAILDAAGACTKQQDGCYLIVTIDKDVYNKYLNAFDLLIKLFFYGDVEINC